MGATFVYAQDATSPEYDRSLAWSVLLLLALGLVMVYSASIATAGGARHTGGVAQYYLVRHAVLLGAALLVAMLVFLVPVRVWQKSHPAHRRTWRPPQSPSALTAAANASPRAR